jgi:hypothetical protein
MSKKRGVLLCVIAIPVAMAVSSCTSSSALHVLNSDLTARQFTGDSNITQSMAAVTGTVRNESDSAAAGCRVTVEFFDDRNGSLGSSSTDRASLGPGESWSFSVQLTNGDAWKARSYKIIATNR